MESATGEACGACDSEEPDRPGRGQINPGIMFDSEDVDLNRSSRPVRTCMPGGVAAQGLKL